MMSLLRYIKRWFLHNIGPRKTLADLVRESDGTPTVFISGTQSLLLVLPDERKLYMFHENSLKVMGSHRTLALIHRLFISKDEALDEERKHMQEFLPEDLDAYQRAEGRLLRFATFKVNE